MDGREEKPNLIAAKDEFEQGKKAATENLIKAGQQTTNAADQYNRANEAYETSAATMLGGEFSKSGQPRVQTPGLTDAPISLSAPTTPVSTLSNAYTDLRGTGVASQGSWEGFDKSQSAYAASQTPSPLGAKAQAAAAANGGVIPSAGPVTEIRNEQVIDPQTGKASTREVATLYGAKTGVTASGLEKARAAMAPDQTWQQSGTNAILLDREGTGGAQSKAWLTNGKPEMVAVPREGGGTVMADAPSAKNIAAARAAEDKTKADQLASRERAQYTMAAHSANMADFRGESKERSDSFRAGLKRDAEIDSLAQREKREAMRENKMAKANYRSIRRALSEGNYVDPALVSKAEKHVARTDRGLGQTENVDDRMEYFRNRLRNEGSGQGQGTRNQSSTAGNTQASPSTGEGDKSVGRVKLGAETQTEETQPAADKAINLSMATGASDISLSSPSTPSGAANTTSRGNSEDPDAVRERFPSAFDRQVTLSSEAAQREKARRERWINRQNPYRS